MDRIGAGQFDKAVKFGDPVLDRLEGPDRLAKGFARDGIVARDFHQRFGPAGLFVRRDNRLQGKDMERRGARVVARCNEFRGRSGEDEVRNAAAVVKAVDGGPCDAGQVRYDERRFVAGRCEDDSDVREQPARNPVGVNV